jgi:hypothetical protein
MEYVLVITGVVVVVALLAPAAVVRRELALWRWRRRARRSSLRLSPRLTARR